MSHCKRLQKKIHDNTFDIFLHSYGSLLNVLIWQQEIVVNNNSYTYVCFCRGRFVFSLQLVALIAPVNQHASLFYLKISEKEAMGIVELRLIDFFKCGREVQCARRENYQSEV